MLPSPQAYGQPHILISSISLKLFTIQVGPRFLKLNRVGILNSSLEYNILKCYICTKNLKDEASYTILVL